MLQITRILPLLLPRVEHQTIRTQGAPRLSSNTGPVLVTLVWILEDVGVRGEFREGRAPGDATVSVCGISMR